MKGYLKKVVNVENILCLFIIMCPILDMLSFIFRNIFNTSISPSTVIRPIIPIATIIYLFLKQDRKFKINSIIIGFIYLIYAILHLYMFNNLKTGSSYSNIIHETQYLINYTFMILNLFIFIYVFKNKETTKLKNSVIIAMYIYIISIFISILTNTSSSTYIEGMGKKGWFESGNSIGTILILGMYIYMQLIENKKYRKIIIPLIISIGIFLTIFLGTRVGLYGFILTICVYVFVELIYTIIHTKKISKKTLAIGIVVISLIILVSLTIGSTTIKRRKYLNSIEGNIVDESTNSESHITGSLLEIKEKIDENKLEAEYMTEAQKKSIIELYNICNKLEITNNDQRMQQLIYNAVLVKNQTNIMSILFGNGYLNNYRELILEMEIPAFIFNFGIIGFILYFIPFLIIFIYAIYIGFKEIKKIDKEYMQLLFGMFMVFAISFFSGYTFFNSSVMIIIVIINTLMINKIVEQKRS